MDRDQVRRIASEAAAPTMSNAEGPVTPAAADVRNPEEAVPHPRRERSFFRQFLVAHRNQSSSSRGHSGLFLQRRLGCDAQVERPVHQ